jgi:hypothetical protein
VILKRDRRELTQQLRNKDLDNRKPGKRKTVSEVSKREDTVTLKTDLPIKLVWCQ